MSYLNFRARNGRLKKGMLLGAVLGALTVSATVPPVWWDTYGLTNSNPPNDNAVATQGQAKHAVDSARQYLNAELAPIGGAGAQLEAMVTESWFTDLAKNNYVVTNSQLKSLAAPFYDRLNAVGFNAWPTGMVIEPSTGYPWTATTADDAPDSPATLGQIKFLFSVETEEWFALDSDSDGLPDNWEIHFGFNPLDDGIYTDSHGNVQNDGIYGPYGDPDNDGFTTLYEAISETSPDSASSFPQSFSLLVELVSPNQLTSRLESDSYVLKAEVIDADLAIDRVEFYANDERLGTDYYPSNDLFAWTWYYLPQVGVDTSYSIRAVVIDVYGHRAESVTQALNVLVDSDDDFLPDSWEMNHFLNLDEVASGDPDIDGATNLYEYENGTDPNVGTGADDPANAESVITMTSPIDESNHFGFRPIIISADASDTDTPIDRVEFYYESNNNPALIATAYSPASGDTYMWNWKNYPTSTVDVTYSLYAVVFDVYGHEVQSLAVDLTIQADSDVDGLPDQWEIGYLTDLSQDGLADQDGDGANNYYEYLSGSDPGDNTDKPADLPAVAINWVAPSNGDEGWEGSSIRMIASPAGGGTPIDRAEFYVDGVLRGVDYTASSIGEYDFNWVDLPVNNEADTDYSLQVRLIDGYGHIVNSSMITYTVFADSDLDGMRDEWERAHFPGQLVESILPVDDPDDDGANNLFESLEDGDPNLAKSPKLNANWVVAMHFPSGTEPVTAWEGDSVELIAVSTGSDTEVLYTEFLYDGNLIGSISDVSAAGEYAYFWTNLPHLGDGEEELLVTARAVDVYGHVVVSTEQALLRIRGDADGDRLQDDWEMLYFGNLDETPTGDKDNDGYSNLYEHEAGSHPTNDPNNNPNLLPNLPGDADSVVVLDNLHDGVYFWEGDSVGLRAEVTESVTEIERVDFLADGIVIGSDYTPLGDFYAVDWNGLPSVEDSGVTVYVLTARVINVYGYAVDSSNSITIRVYEDKDGDRMRDDDERTYFNGLSETPYGDYDSDNITNIMELELNSNPADYSLSPSDAASTVSLIAPVDGSVFWEGDTLTLVAKADDSDTDILGVEFFDGATLLGIDYTAEADSYYSLPWSDLPAGGSGQTQHNLTAVVIDVYETRVVSTAVNIYIQGDSDSDGLGDDWEMLYFGNLNAGPNDDYEPDNVINLYEYILGFNPALSDSNNDLVLDDAEDRDSDGIPDVWELLYKEFVDYETADADQDPDRDTLSNLVEFQNGTHPGVFNEAIIDEDGDGLLDSWEQQIIDAGLTDQDNDNDVDLYDVIGSDDFDQDGFTNVEEYANGTDPTSALNDLADDPDADGLGSGAEILLLTDPLRADNPLVGLRVLPLQ